jgi:hypothetical protein
VTLSGWREYDIVIDNDRWFVVAKVKELSECNQQLSRYLDILYSLSEISLVLFGTSTTIENKIDEAESASKYLSNTILSATPPPTKQVDVS